MLRYDRTKSNDNMKVLIIDDSKEDIDIIQNLLKKTDIIKFDIIHEYTLSSASQHIEKEKEKFDCIILDLNLPDSSGMNSLKVVQKRFPELPIVVLTVIDDEKIAIESLREGAQDYLVKGSIDGELILRSIIYAIERKKVDNKLRKSETIYRNFIDTILEGLWMVDQEGNTVYTNQQLLNMLGYDKYEIIGQPFFNFVNEKFREDAKKFFERRKSGLKDKYDFCFNKKDGSELWVIVSASPMFDHKGKFTGSLGLLTDISKHKATEKSLEQSYKKQLKLSKEWYSTFNSISDVVCIVDIEGKISRCNNASIDLFKIPKEKIIGRTCWEILDCPQERKDKCPILFATKDAKKRTLTSKIKDKWYRSSVDPIFDNDNGHNLIGGVHIISDITKYKETQIELQESELALKKSQEVAHVGHWTWYPKSNIVKWSDEMFKIFGITKETYNSLGGNLDKVVDNTIYPDDIETVKKVNQSVIDQKHGTPIEYRTIWPDNTIHTVYAIPGEIYLDESGNVERLFGIVQDITERKNIEQELIALKNFSENILDNMMDGVLVINKDDTIIYCNNGMVNIMGLSQKNMLDKNILKDFPDNTIRFFAHYYLEAKKTLKSVFYPPINVVTPVGKLLYQSGWIIPIVNNKKIEKIICTASDLTEQKITQDKLKEATERYKSLFEGAKDAVFIIDTETGIISDANIEAEKLMKKSRGEIINKHHTTLYTIEDVDIIQANFKKHIETKGEIPIYGNVLASDGIKIPIEVNASIITLPDGKQIIQGIFRNITERKAAEEKLKRSEAMLAEAQRVAHIGSWEWDITTRKITWSEETYHLHDIDPKKREPSYEELLQIYHQDDIPTFINVVNKAIKDGTPYSIICRIIHQDGSVHYLEGRGEAIFNSKTRPIKLFGTSMDVTERELAKKEIELTNKELKRSNQELEQFAYVASHDLQEPLRSISGFTELLALNYRNKLGPEADEFIGYITAGTKRMQQMVNDLLELSRIGTKGKEFFPTDLNIIINKVLENLRNLIEENKAEVIVDKMPIISVDESQINRVFQNLIDNAIKFRKKDIPPKIHISTKKAIDKWIFSVKDNGIGIDPKNFPKLFIIFQRLHSRDKYAGTGIGLAMCKKIIQRHKGEIWVESKLEDGSIFSFSIPTR